MVKPVGGPKRRAWKAGGVCKQLLYNDGVLAMAAELGYYVDDLPAGIQFSLLNEQLGCRRGDGLGCGKNAKQGIVVGVTKCLEANQPSIPGKRHLCSRQQSLVDLLSGASDQRRKLVLVDTGIPGFDHEAFQFFAHRFLPTMKRCQEYSIVDRGNRLQANIATVRPLPGEGTF